jgi:hypothetical protein
MIKAHYEFLERQLKCGIAVQVSTRKYVGQFKEYTMRESSKRWWVRELCI